MYIGSGSNYKRCLVCFPDFLPHMTLMCSNCLFVMCIVEWRGMPSSPESLVVQGRWQSSSVHMLCRGDCLDKQG